MLKIKLILITATLFLLGCQSTNTQSSSQRFETKIYGDKVELTIKDYDYTIQIFKPIDENKKVLMLWNGDEPLTLIEGIFLDIEGNPPIDAFTRGYVNRINSEGDKRATMSKNVFENTAVPVRAVRTIYDEDSGKSYQFTYLIQVEGGFVFIYSTVFDVKMQAQAKVRTENIIRTAIEVR